MSGDISISVVIPVYNAGARLARVLAALQRVSAEDVEVILADDGSTDGSLDLCRRSGFTVLEGEHRGPSAARNAGILTARGRLIAFTDSDCIVPDGSSIEFICFY